MARKLYRTKKGITDLSMGLVIPNRKEKVYLDFTGGVLEPTFIPSTLIVEDPEIQKVIEKHPFMGTKYELAKEFKEISTASPKVEEKGEEKIGEAKVKKIGYVKNVQTAITHLIKNGADPDKLDTYEDVISVAKGMKIEFTQLKSE